MTYGEVVDLLRRAGIESAEWEASLLIEKFCRVGRAMILADRGRDYPSPALSDAASRRATRYPLQYILGTWEFYGLPFTVDERCLIPRADTEVIVDAALEELKNKKNGSRFLDLCTGSGCIAAAILHSNENTRGFAVEIDEGTAALATENLKNLGLLPRCPVIVGDATTDLFPEGEQFDVIVSNPPYVTSEEMLSLEEELSYEPKIALTDGGDGLSILRKIVSVYLPHLKKDGALILEHGWQQSPALAALAHEKGLSHTPIYDYAGHIRGALLRL